MAKISENQVDLFAMEDHPTTPKIDVVKMEYIEAQSVEWKELFSGYDSLKAITFSSGINFIYSLLELFKEAEIIFGCEQIMSYTLQDIMSFQNQMLERIREEMPQPQGALIQRINKKEVQLWIAKEKMSHEKIYLLSAHDGRKRVITGSANMSYNAFTGRQRENICYIDGDQAYEWYLSVFNNLKETSTNEVPIKSLMIADLDENIDELPISREVKVNKLVVVQPDNDSKKEVEFILDVQNISKKLQPSMPRGDKKTGKIQLTPDIITKLRRNRHDDIVRDKEQKSEYPQLIVDPYDGTVKLNDVRQDLNPSKEDISNDVNLFLEYMKGYDRFHGDSVGMQYRYFEFANWFFCSPFMAVMRDAATRYNQVRLPYPVFGLVYGQSKAGKTSFLETMLKMMIGQKPKISAPDFTRKSIEGLKYSVKGAPIIVDDLTNTRFNQHAIETIKDDDFGVRDHLLNYPVVVISANEDVKAVAPEVIRRTVICRVEAGLTNTEVMQSNTVRSVQQRIGTAFYREYLRRMLEIVPDLINELKSEESVNAPDILKYSSEIIVEILKEFSETELPPFIRPLSLDNYFSEQVTGKYAIKTIRTAWNADKKAFSVNRKANELRYNAGAIWEADRIMKELPETLEARKARESIVMNLTEAEDFFDMKFNKGLFSSWF
ncbi:MAG: NgoFVII family restriction endonuclease [Erysipelotrichaceae bacterium]|nr:NgoFVII family restriction endonuclease [Erysipelotrichaceae bacterium]